VYVSHLTGSMGGPRRLKHVIAPREEGKLSVKFTMIVLPFLATLLIGAGIWLWTPDKPRAELEAKYLNAPTDIIKVLGTHLHVRDSGPKTATAIIMLHGFGSSLQTWDPWAAALENEYRIVRFDLPGSGLSEPDPTGDYTDKRSMALIEGLMDKLDLARANLIGNSIGGRIAWKFAALHPRRVLKLVLISPDGFASVGFAYGQAPTVPATVKLMKYILPKALVRMNLSAAYGNPAVLADKTVDRYYDLMLGPGTRQAMIERMEQTTLEAPEPLLRSIQALTLLVWGEKDALIPFTNAGDYGRNLPNAKLVSFPGLGHLPQEEAPALSLQPVESFLTE
jgi:pimeloyl-ACP methyl ester carboxylesterase